MIEARGLVKRHGSTAAAPLSQPGVLRSLAAGAFAFSRRDARPLR